MAFTREAIRLTCAVVLANEFPGTCCDMLLVGYNVYVHMHVNLRYIDIHSICLAVMLTVSTWLPTMLATTYWNKLIYIYCCIGPVYICMYVGR